jgi:quinol monooxygenase YgiN
MEMNNYLAALGKTCLAVGIAGSMSTMAVAQLASVPFPTDAPTYSVSFIEAAPHSRQKVIELMKAQVAASRAEPGNVAEKAIEQIGEKNDFALLEVWKDPAAMDAHHANEATKQFRAKLAPLLRSPVDERDNTSLAVNLQRTKAALNSRNKGYIYVLTHADSFPKNEKVAWAQLNTLFEPSSKLTGNISFDLWKQNPGNHVNILEVWKNHAALEAHWMQPVNMQFRANFLKGQGALYDQREYHEIR